GQPKVSESTGRAALASPPAVKASSRVHTTPTPEQIQDSLNKQPLRFEVNQGQSNQAYQFLARGGGYTLLLSGTDSGPRITPPHPTGEATELHMQLAGANPAPTGIGVIPLPGIVNYYVGNDPSQWHVGIPTYARVEYQDVYDGIDLVYYSQSQQV